MGRQYRATRLVQTIHKNLVTQRTQRLREVVPIWLSVVEQIPPTESHIRTIPVRHQDPDPRMHKPRRTYLPQRIVYEEDELRQTFFHDHPWELARPRVIVESDGKDTRCFDWSTGLIQPGMPLCGESVVQRQLWLMHSGGMDKDQAYDSARREFYTLRHREDVERRVAEEEARMVGAYFGKSALQVGMQLEDEAYEDWKKWAAEETAKAESERTRAYTTFGGESAEGEVGLEDDLEAREAL
ncbi:37S ribosomal protein rsm25 [Niveomyces insectorum RCEF 264]|uniref:37S ribosomal protein S25, mitochondrial n=1 Tax=Niveomyces insectorum RCEF 264 TaxID=1081102 RepID=A0A167NQ78_9HYPO|nr:37S ribosomal protein rsm25 [Niveomyces insectorum RCEF 264]